ncbi:MAG: VCBS repeat-containing protein [Deltaproteobacteria bacterium]|nr:VCBS repeat-containing protein [Deltaproteobacteria bacterium]
MKVRPFTLPLVIIFLLLSLAPLKAVERIRVAILPWKVHSEGNIDYAREALLDMLASRMAVERHIMVLKESSVKEVFSRHGQKGMTEDLLRKMGKELGADYILSGSLSFIADNLSLDVKMINVRREEAPMQSVSQGRGMESLIPLVSQLALDINARILEREGLPVTVGAFGAAPTYTGGFVRKEVREARKGEEDFIITTREKDREKNLWKSHTFSPPLKGMDVGDVDGDGKNEVVLIDRHNLYIYRMRGQVLGLVKEFKGASFEENFTIDIADLNKNGVPEIYVTRMSNKRLDSYALEFRDNEFKTIVSGLPWFLRVIEYPEIGQTLIGQRLSFPEVFHGAIYKLGWKEGKIVEIGKMDLPSDLKTYGFSILDLNGDGVEEVLAFDDRDRLKVYTKKDGKWSEVWSGTDFFGGSLNVVEMEAPLSAQDSIPAGIIKGRLLSDDLDGDGKMEVIINKNEPGTLGRYFEKVRSYKTGEIVDMSWEGNSFEENWRTKRIDGYIADYLIKDIDNDGKKELVIIVMEGETLLKTGASSYIVAYKLNIR